LVWWEKGTLVGKLVSNRTFHRFQAAIRSKLVEAPPAQGGDAIQHPWWMERKNKIANLG
jgi:hypothetical protein